MGLWRRVLSALMPRPDVPPPMRWLETEEIPT